MAPTTHKPRPTMAETGTGAATGTTRGLPFILFTIFIDSMGFGLIMPVLPDLLMTIGNVNEAGAVAIGLEIGQLMAIATFFAAPILGNLSDRFGRRPVLLISLAGLMVDYVLLAVAQTLPLLYIARTVSGVFGGSFGAAQAAIADISAPENRARNFGMVGAAFGIGFVAGPVIGGLLGEADPRTPFIIASALCGINLLYGWFVFPETLPPERRRPFSIARANPLGALGALRAMPGAWRVALVLVLWQVASLVYPMTWSFYGIIKFGWSSSMIGASLAAVGIVIAISQTTVTGPLVKRLGERDAASIGLIFAVIGYLAYAFVSQGWMAFAIMPLLALSAPVQASLMALLSRRAASDKQGEVQGVAAMTMSVGTLFAPILLTGSMERFTRPDAPIYFPGAAFIVAAVFGIAALIALRSLPRVTRDNDAAAAPPQMPPATES